MWNETYQMYTVDPINRGLSSVVFWYDVAGCGDIVCLLSVISTQTVSVSNQCFVNRPVLCIWDIFLVRQWNLGICIRLV